uniref:Uncharacterized protein n=1 Tax=Chlamydomonas euryale TaxID=1486919 RepID=A0A7R9YQW2_9CHLO|eukprot:122573-Chlamydomonas_euryale.AAC.4
MAWNRGRKRRYKKAACKGIAVHHVRYTARKTPCAAHDGESSLTACWRWHAKSDAGSGPTKSVPVLSSARQSGSNSVLSQVGPPLRAFLSHLNGAPGAGAQKAFSG